jgi:hypothetical protein
MKKGKSSSTKSSSYALIVIAGLAVLALGYSYFKTPTQVAQPIGVNEVTELGFASLTLAPVTATVPSGLLDLNFKTPMKIVIDGGATAGVPNKLVAATVELSYDPAKLTITDVAKGDFFGNTFAAPVINATTKKVTFSFAVPPADGGKTGSGVLATFMVQPKVAGTATITFAAPTNVRAESINENVLKVADPFTFTTNPKTPSDIVDDLDIPGDQVNAQDYVQYVLDFNKAGAAGFIRSDINKDGKVNIADYPIFVREWSL